MSNQPFVSVIIPTLGREDELLETISGLQASTYPADCWELIVVDQTKNHTSKVTGVRLFSPPEITFASLTKARNFGISKAKNPEIILFVDDDVVVKPDFIAQHVTSFNDPKVGAVVGRVVVPGKKQELPASVPVGKITWFGAFRDNYASRTPQTVDTFIGCNFSLRATILPKTGGFDEKFKGNALREDSEMAVRVRKAGFIIQFNPEAELIHKEAKSGGTRSQTDRIQWYHALFYNNFLFYAKSYQPWRLPFFILHMWRPILVCSFYYGKGKPTALFTPWRGIRAGIRAARSK